MKGTRGDGPTDVASLLDALGDSDCRMILEELTEPMTADELAESCDISSSTAYRKLGILEETSLLRERTEIRRDGHHTSRYEIAFDRIRIDLDDTHALDAHVERPKRTPDEQLYELWSEVRKER